MFLRFLKYHHLNVFNLSQIHIVPVQGETQFLTWAVGFVFPSVRRCAAMLQLIPVCLCGRLARGSLLLGKPCCYEYNEAYSCHTCADVSSGTIPGWGTAGSRAHQFWEIMLNCFPKWLEWFTFAPAPRELANCSKSYRLFDTDFHFGRSGMYPMDLTEDFIV